MEKAETRGRSGCGKVLTAAQVDVILEGRSRKPPETFAHIARKLRVDYRTVRRYADKLLDVGGDVSQVVCVSERSIEEMQPYDMERSFMSNLEILREYKARIRGRIRRGDIPDTITPLMVKQLVETEIAIVRLPTDLKAARRNLYKQISSRKLEVEETEFEELGQSGDMPRVAEGV